MKRIGNASIALLIVLLVTSITIWNTNLVTLVHAADGPVYIKDDGSVIPSNASIAHSGNSYVLTGDINTSLVIERDNIIVDGAGYTLQGKLDSLSKGIILNGRRNVTVGNFNIDSFYYGIYLNYSTLGKLCANNMTRNNYVGILLLSSNTNVISGNTVKNNGDGIDLGNSSHNDISCNNVLNNTEFCGVHADSSSENNFTRNNIIGSYYALTLDGSSRNIISENNITNNGHAIDLWRSPSNVILSNNITDNSGTGIYIGETSANRIVNNNIARNNGSGINLYYATDGLICKNILAENHFDGITFNLLATNNDVYENNIIRNNICGIALTTSYSNRIYLNNLINNTSNVKGNDASRNLWSYPRSATYKFNNTDQAGILGNYWSDYSGIDANLDGIGDQPHHIYFIGSLWEYESDYHPLIQPIEAYSSICTLNNVSAWWWFSDTVVSAVVSGDVDSDGQNEIVTGGYYNDGTRAVAQLVVWNSTNLIVKQLTTWYWTGNTNINSVAFGDVDCDGGVEIVTGGYYFDGTRKVAQLVVWNSSNLAVKGIRTWYWINNTAINSVAVGDVDGDGQAEIVTGGYYNDGTRNIAQLVVWNGADLSVDRLTTWYWTDNTVINSVTVGDVDADGQVEIVTGGCYNDGARDVSQLVVWAGSSLAVDRLTSWYWTGDTAINSVAVGDVDEDGQAEVVTAGYFNDGTRNNAQLVVWAGSTLAVDRLTSWYWASDTIIYSVALGDIDGDSDVEIVTGGCYDDGARDVSQMVAWSGSSLAVENIRTWYWFSDTVINSVCLSDLNGDWTAEIVTGGAYHDGSRWNAQLTVWGMRQTA